jgi:catechol 2,3-dioxygenase-like lactoylglutathione lyase family enzyme
MRCAWAITSSAGSGNVMAMRGRTGACVLLALALLCAAVAPDVRAGGANPLLRAVGPIGITVADMERSVKFYSEVLGFEKVSDVEVAGREYERLLALSGLRMRVVRMRLGEESIQLTEYVTPRGRPVPPDSRSHDRWFQHIAIIVSDMDRAYAELRYRVEHISPAPQRLPDWNPTAAGIRAFYFKDPDGHPLEVLWFPPGKGDARWQNTSGPLFLGVDHTAIVVASTDTSLRCYRDTLGLRVTGESHNHGIEQERLNSVSGARLRITTLRAPKGPGIELLEYLHPRDGRPVPEDVRANDLAHWHTMAVVADAEAGYRALRAGACRVPSAAVIAAAEPALGFRQALIARDPDGHALMLAAP